jgi:hypothetical protein
MRESGFSRFQRRPGLAGGKNPADDLRCCKAVAMLTIMQRRLEDSLPFGEGRGGAVAMLTIMQKGLENPKLEAEVESYQLSQCSP